MKKVLVSLTPGEVSLLTKTRSIHKRPIAASLPELIDAVFDTHGEPLTGEDIAIFTDALNVARWYALANEETKEAIWRRAVAVRKRIRRHIRQRPQPTTQGESDAKSN